MGLFRDDFRTYLVGAELANVGPYSEVVSGFFMAFNDPGVYGVSKNVAVLAKGNATGRIHVYYTGNQYSSGRARTAARIWTGLAHSLDRHLGVTAYYTYENPYVHHGLFAVLHSSGTSFALMRGTGTNTFETLQATPVAWNLNSWYEIELTFEGGVATSTLRDGSGAPLATVSAAYSPAPASEYRSGIVLHSQNNINQRIAFDWVEFETGGTRPAPTLDAPVALHMSESLTGVFADPTVDATFFSLVDIPVGSTYSVGDQISGRVWYSGTIRDKSIQGGLTSYTLETLLATLGRVTPRESLILVAGESGVPNPLTLRECLIRFLTYYRVPFDPDVPEFYLRAGEDLVVPTVPAFVIQPDQLNPASVYEQLEPFYGVFRSYTFRADEQNRLVVRPPAWVDTIGVRLTLWRRRQENDRTPTRQTNGVPWSTTRKPTVEWTATVDGVAYSGALPAALELGAPLQDIHIGPVTVRIQWRSSDNRVQASVWPPPPVDLTVGSLYSIAFTLRPETLPGDEDELLDLTVADLAPDEVVTQSADTVINQAVIPVRARTFQPAQQVMQAAAMVLASPGGLMPGLFGNTPFGPMDEELETPGGFLELVNDTVQEGVWFWPADDTVVIQPGGNVTVAYDVEEWAEQWRSPSAPHAAASQVNTYSDTVDLPANGAEVRLFDFQFPRQTTDFAPSPYGARGTVWGRWRAGENPGIELRVGNSHFVEFGYLPEMGIFGQTVYFLWGAIVKLNGTGTTFTVGDLHTYRFGFSRGADGLWEDGANVPGLSESQSLYPNRVYTAPELPYEVTAAVAIAMARGIVEENLTPKAVYTLTVPATRPDGYAVGPWHMGRAAHIPALGITGRVTALDYGEAHTAQAQGDTSSVTIDVETTAAPAGSRAAATGYRRAAYGLSHYQQEE